METVVGIARTATGVEVGEGARRCPADHFRAFGDPVSERPQGGYPAGYGTPRCHGRPPPRRGRHDLRRRADIFAREAQAVWSELRPAVDTKVLDGARALGLPDRIDALGGLIGPDRLAVLCAALVRVGLDDVLAERIRSG